MRSWILCVAALALVGVPIQASATIVDVTYTGTIYNFSDQTGVFGATTRGDPYVAHYVFDTTKGFVYSSSNYNYAYGGTYFGAPSPLISASVTINGLTVSIGGGYRDEIHGLQGSEQYHFALNYRDTPNEYVKNYLENVVYGSNSMSGSITGPFVYNISPGNYNYGSFQIDEYNYNTGYEAYAYGSAILTSLTVSPAVLDLSTAAVPETSTWAMMLLGFAGIGFAAYRWKPKRKLLVA